MDVNPHRPIFPSGITFKFRTLFFPILFTYTPKIVWWRFKCAVYKSVRHVVLDLGAKSETVAQPSVITLAPFFSPLYAIFFSLELFFDAPNYQM